MAPRRGQTFEQFVDIVASMSLSPSVTQMYDEVVWSLHLQVFFLYIQVLSYLTICI